MADGPANPFQRSPDPRQAFLDRETTLLLALAAVVGLLGGVAAFALREAIKWVELLAFGGPPLAAAVDWRLVVAPAVGALLTGIVVTRWLGEARGHGVPDVMRSVQPDGKPIRGRVAIWKTVTSALTIGAGGSCGREGPIAHIGAAVGSFIATRTRLTRSQGRVLTAAGAAAGIAGSFNAPIAGAFFALEIILGNFAVESFAPIVVASVSATVFTHAVAGKAPVFGAAGQTYSLVHAGELLAYVALGLLAAVVSVAFIRTLVASEELFERLALPAWLRPAVGGLGVGAIALLGLPHVMGNGDEVIEGLLDAGEAAPAVHFLLLLLGAKLVATCLTLGAGGSGGVFTPSLYLGACLGAVVGRVAGAVLPFEVAPPGAYALVGMAAVCAGTAHAPITMAIMLFELTNDYRIIVPLMVSASLAAIGARRLLPESIYTHRLARQGIHLHRGLEALLMHDLRVADAMRRGEAETLAPTARLTDVVARFLEVRTLQLYVLAPGDRYEGVIYLQDVKPVLGADPRALGVAIAVDVVSDRAPTLDPEDPLTVALDVLHRSGLSEVAVTATGPDGARRFLGTVSEHDILAVYNQEVLRKDALLARFVSRAGGTPADPHLHTDYFELPEGYALTQVAVPPALVGATLREADLRRRAELNVLAVKRRSPDGDWVKEIPDPHQPLGAADLLVVMGPRASIDALPTFAREPASAGRPGA